MVSRALSFIWGTPLASVTVPDVVAHVGCNRRALERRFKQGTGRGMLAEIQACRVDLAKRLIEEIRLPLKECAARAGFSTSGHMRQVFGKQFGMSPETLGKQTRTG